MSLLSLFSRSNAAPAAAVPERVEPPVSQNFGQSSVDQPSAWMQEIGFAGSGSNVSTLPRVTPALAQKHATVTASCSVVSGDLSKLPIGVYQTGADGIEKQVRDHPLNYLLNIEASSGIPARVARFGLGYSFTLRGRGYAYSPRDGAGELELFEAIHPDMVMVLKNGRDRFYDFEDGAGVRRRVSGRAMVHLRYMAEDGWTGRSPIEVAAETFGIALAGQEAAGRAAGGQSFKLAANLAAFDSDDEEYERARARLKNAMRRDADGQVLIAGPDDKFSVLGMSAADIQLLQSRKFDREQIAALYRVPPSKLQMLENGVKANGEQQALDYKADCLTHWGGFIEAELGLTLLTERERRAGMVLRHEYDALLVSTLKERVDAFSKACGGPFMSPDEVRPYFKKGPIEGGAKLYPPSNMTREEDTEKKGESE